MNNGCEFCSSYSGEKYCGKCGKRLDGKDDLFLTFGIITALLVGIMLIAEIASLIANFTDVFDNVGNWGTSLTILIPEPFRLFSLTGTISQVYWIVITCILLVSVCLTLWKFAVALINRGMDGGNEPLRDQPLFWIGMMFSFTLFFTLAYSLIINAIGTSIDASWLDAYTDVQLKYMLAEAPVWEELITRVLYIGVPITILAIVTTRKISGLKCLLGGFGFSKVAVILLVISAIIFGLAHYDGWGMEKILQATVGGLTMGYVYIKYGLYASITLHFTTNYSFAFSWLGIGWIGTLLQIMVIGLGIAATIYIALRAKSSVSRIKGLPNLPKV